MPRRLLLDGLVIEDAWHYAESEAPAAAARGRVIVPFDVFRAGPDGWPAAEALGVVLAPAHAVEDLAPFLPTLSLVACNFPGPGEGRGYTQARLLRERYGFDRQLRATGYVRRDQVFFMARCGFNALELSEEELEAGARALATFTAAYQSSNDAGLRFPLPHR